MLRYLGAALAIFVSTALAAGTITNRGMPDPAKLYHVRADCHIAYDLLIDDLDKNRPVSDELGLWAAQHENAGKAGQPCPAVPPQLSVRAKDRAIATRDGRAVAETYWSKQGDPVAGFELGFAHFNGFFADKTRADGVELMRQAATKGDPMAMFIMGTLHTQGAFGKKDYKAGIPLIEGAARSGHVDAMFRAGIFNYEGIGKSKDLRKAYGFFESAAKGGHMYGAIMATMMLSEGKGIRKDTDRAYRIALAIADEGEVYGMALAAVALAQSGEAEKHEKDILYWMDQTIANGDDKVRAVVEPARAQMAGAFERSRAAPAYTPRTFKACPMKTYCTVNHYTGLQSCTTNKDYWSDCDG